MCLPSLLWHAVDRDYQAICALWLHRVCHSGAEQGTPNICINLLKLLTIYMNSGIDPMDGKRKDAGFPFRPDEIGTYEEFFAGMPGWWTPI